MSDVVIDTNIASLMIDARPQLAPNQPHFVGATVYISFQTVAEMRFGALKAGWGANRHQRLEAFLTNLKVIDYSDALGHLWAEIMHEAQRAGRRLEAGDGWIAATAKLLNAPLLTHDKDFDVQACPSITITCYAP